MKRLATRWFKYFFDYVLSMWRDLQAHLMAYLRVNGEAWRPILWRYDLTDPVFTSLWCDFTHVIHGILEILLCRPESWRVLQSMRPYPFIAFPHRQRMAPPLDSRHIQRQGSPSTKRNVGSVRRITAIVGRLGRIDLEASSGRDRMRGCAGGGIPTTDRRWDHHFLVVIKCAR